MGVVGSAAGFLRPLYCARLSSGASRDCGPKRLHLNWTLLRNYAGRPAGHPSSEAIEFRAPQWSECCATLEQSAGATRMLHEPEPRPRSSRIGGGTRGPDSRASDERSARRSIIASPTTGASSGLTCRAHVSEAPSRDGGLVDESERATVELGASELGGWGPRRRRRPALVPLAPLNNWRASHALAPIGSSECK